MIRIAFYRLANRPLPISDWIVGLPIIVNRLASFRSHFLRISQGVLGLGFAVRIFLLTSGNKLSSWGLPVFIHKQEDEYFFREFNKKSDGAILSVRFNCCIWLSERKRPRFRYWEVRWRSKSFLSVALLLVRKLTSELTEKKFRHRLRKNVTIKMSF